MNHVSVNVDRRKVYVVYLENGIMMNVDFVLSQFVINIAF